MGLIFSFRISVSLAVFSVVALAACGSPEIDSTTGESSLNGTETVADSCNYSSAVAETLVQAAESLAGGNTTSKGQCWKYTDNAIESMMRSYGKGRPADHGVRWPTMSATQFAESALARKLRVAQGMLLRYAPEYVAKPANAAPVGSVLIYRPGKCGFHGQYGHVEVKTAANRFVSDYVQFGRSCSPDFVFVPSSGCSTL